MQLGVDVGPGRRAEPEHVVGEAIGDELVTADGNGASAEEELRGRADTTPEQRQGVGALLVDVGGEQRTELVEETGDRLVDDRGELGIVGVEVETAARCCGDDRPRQPTRGVSTRCREQVSWRIDRPVAGLHVTRHDISSIVIDVRTPHRSRRRLAWSVAAIVVLTACTGDDDIDTGPATSVAATTTTMPARTNDGRLVIGVYLPQTGPGASLGEPMITAVRSTVATINAAGGVLGSDIELLVLDEGAPAGPAALLAEGVDAIVGPASSRNALSQLATIVRPDSGVVTCSPTATALALDNFPDNGYFFRTVPSDSLQMTALARRAERTGVPTVAVGFLDDPYGRGLADRLIDEIEQRRRQDVVAAVPFGADQEDLSQTVTDLLADDPGLVVVLGDADDGGRLLSALDAADRDNVVQVFVNDAIRTAAALQQLSSDFRSRLSGIAPLALSDEVNGYFAAHAVDCVNLIALATVEAGTDAPSAIRLWMAPVSGGGRQCGSFVDCVALLDAGLQIDYNGLSGPVELSSTTGDTTRALFVQFGFDSGGDEIDRRVFEIP